MLAPDVVMVADGGGLVPSIRKPIEGRQRVLALLSRFSELAPGVAITRPLVNGAPLPERSVPIRERKSVPTAWLQLTLTEGRNRQVRRMTAAVGHPTLRLVRWSMSGITLDGLQPGAWQMLDENAARRLWNSLTAPPT